MSKQADKTNKVAPAKAAKPKTTQIQQTPIDSHLLQLAREDPARLTPAQRTQLQRTFGNRALSQWVGNPSSVNGNRSLSPGHLVTPSPLHSVIQPKLTVNAVDDKYEQEADSVAKEVVQKLNAPQPDAAAGVPTAQPTQAQRQTEEEEPIAQRIQRQGAPSSTMAASQPDRDAVLIVPPALQRQSPEEEELHLQRQETEDEELQLQRQELEEEEIQLQRQEIEDKELLLQRQGVNLTMKNNYPISMDESFPGYGLSTPFGDYWVVPEDTIVSFPVPVEQVRESEFSEIEAMWSIIQSSGGNIRIVEIDDFGVSHSGFASKILSQLSILLSKPTGRRLIKTLLESTEPTVIQPGVPASHPDNKIRFSGITRGGAASRPDDRSESLEQVNGIAGLGTSTTILISPDLQNDDVLAYDKNGKKISFPLFILLGHELVHAVHVGTGRNRQDQKLNDQYHNMEEFGTIDGGGLSENKLRNEHGFEKRYGHTGVDKRYDSGIAPKRLQRREVPQQEEMQLQRQELEEEDPEAMVMTQRQPHDFTNGGTVDSHIEDQINQSRGGGRPMEESIRQPMEHAFGADFSDVRIHTNAQAHILNEAIQARAFTMSNDIYFKEGEYRPTNTAGQVLLAHELTHVAQQKKSVNLASTQRQHEEIITARLGGNTHVVQQGETLWNISKNVYGSGKYWRKIYLNNRDRVFDKGNLIYAGTKLILPALDIPIGQKVAQEGNLSLVDKYVIEYHEESENDIPVSGLEPAKEIRLPVFKKSIAFETIELPPVYTEVGVLKSKISFDGIVGLYQKPEAPFSLDEKSFAIEAKQTFKDFVSKSKFKYNSDGTVSLENEFAGEFGSAAGEISALTPPTFVWKARSRPFESNIGNDWIINGKLGYSITTEYYPIVPFTDEIMETSEKLLEQIENIRKWIVNHPELVIPPVVIAVILSLPGEIIVATGMTAAAILTAIATKILQTS